MSKEWPDPVSQEFIDELVEVFDDMPVPISLKARAKLGGLIVRLKAKKKELYRPGKLMPQGKYTAEEIAAYAKDGAFEARRGGIIDPDGPSTTDADTNDTLRTDAKRMHLEILDLTTSRLEGLEARVTELDDNRLQMAKRLTILVDRLDAHLRRLDRVEDRLMTLMEVTPGEASMPTGDPTVTMTEVYPRPVWR